jgi:hypothetical protein
MSGCATCDRRDGDQSHLIPIVGMVCIDCFHRLSVPADGHEFSVLTLARRSIRMFEEQRELIREKAKEVCSK